MSMTTNDDNGPPTGPPKVNPLTAEHYAGLDRVLERAEILEDAIQRAYHIGLDVGQHAAMHERNVGVAKRILAMYPKPQPHPLED
jgi:hypothetical protein